MLIHGLAALLLIQAPSGGAAGRREPLRLTLAEAIERARAASPELARHRALERAADADRSLARAGRIPQLGLAAGYTRNSDVPELATFISPEPGAPPAGR